MNVLLLCAALATAAAAAAAPAGAAAPAAGPTLKALFKEPRQTEDAGREQVAAFARTYSDKAGWEARARNIRACLLKEAHLDPLPARCDLKPIIRGRQERRGYSVENAAFESLPGFFVTGNLYRPADGQAKKPMAAVLCPHGHAKDGRLKAYTQTRCAGLARMGAIVFAYDMIGFGESTQLAHNDPNVLTLQTWDSIRAVDFLLSLPEVDPKRIGCTGESGGGTQTFLLGAADDRVAVLVPCVQVSAHFFGGCQCESGLAIHKSAAHDTSNVEFAALAAPRPQLLISDGKDWTKNTPGVEFPYIWNVYRLYGAQDKVENAHFADEGHDYGPMKRLAMYKFMARYLHLNLKAVVADSGAVDESDAAIEPPDSLRVFTAEHPRPPHALPDSAAVDAALKKAQAEAGRK
ncbi:MAG: acetylxylan esterase [Planctomycetes bacterium]|nr:acetylxylan esterase [Planctomycetota bacterium]